MSTPTSTLADRIREARRQADLTQEELADRIGVSVFALRAWEQGQRSRPRPGTLSRLADATGQPLAWFVEVVAA